MNGVRNLDVKRTTFYDRWGFDIYIRINTF